MESGAVTLCSQVPVGTGNGTEAFVSSSSRLSVVPCGAGAATRHTSTGLSFPVGRQAWVTLGRGHGHHRPSPPARGISGTVELAP